MGLSIVYISFYHAYREFVMPSLASLLFPLASLFSLWMLPSAWGIERLVYGNLAGSLAGLLIMAVMIQKRIRWQWNLNFNNPMVRQTLLVSWPVLIDSMASKIIPFIQKSAASRLPDGSITLLDNSLFITNAVLLLVASPITTAVFPLMGQQRQDDCDGMVIQTFVKAMRAVLFLAVPCVAIVLVASDEIVGILLEYGKFTQADSHATSRLLMILSLMIIPTCFSMIGGRLFFVFQDTKVVCLSCMSFGLLTCPAYYLLSSFFGIEGIAAAQVMIGACTAMMVFALLIVRHKTLRFRELYMSFPPLIAAGALMALACFLASWACSSVQMSLVRFAVMAAAGGLAYVLAARTMKMEELELIGTRLPFVGFLFAGDADAKANSAPGPNSKS
jgi:putative peptidoglycan lipid II flippase